jgi:hypothetical protein
MFCSYYKDFHYIVCNSDNSRKCIKDNKKHYLSGSTLKYVTNLMPVSVFVCICVNRYKWILLYIFALYTKLEL